jgi:4-alpha-glucanotransferase
VGHSLIQRSSGILLACSSIPSPYGIGSFGEDARAWLRFLKLAGQKYWQILPLGVTGWGDSPYQSFSAFAISPYYIDLDTLCTDGLLEKNVFEKIAWGRNKEKVNYSILYKHRKKILPLAFEKFSGGAAFDQFRHENERWLSDYALFMALKAYHKGISWTDWEDEYRLRSARALEKFKSSKKKLIEYYYIEQYFAFSQWRALREYANKTGISVIGDMPIYVALDSADVWAHPELFELDAELKPIRVAGCPPDPFSATGQLWGNPLYRWDVHKVDGFYWWLSRLKESFALFDVIRIDHFRGFESYYAINYGEKDARKGQWIKGPDRDFIDAVRNAIPDAAIIAEDLGYITQELKALLDYSGFPGMKVLQFAFDSRESGDYMPYTYNSNCVVYTGTHDNTTSAGWFKSARREDIVQALDYFDIKTANNGHWTFIRGALASVAALAIIPMQDYLGLDNRARMNTPSLLGNNWQWRMKCGAINEALSEKIARLTSLYGRV